jgi:hypothetical protein
MDLFSAAPFPGKGVDLEQQRATSTTGERGADGLHHRVGVGGQPGPVVARQQVDRQGSVPRRSSSATSRCQ